MVSADAVERYQTGKTAKKLRRTVNEVEREHNGWVLAGVGEYDDAVFPFREHASKSPPRHMTDALYEFYLDDTGTTKPSLVAEQWLNVIGGPIIPFDLKLRESSLASAYEELRPYMHV